MSYLTGGRAKQRRWPEALIVAGALCGIVFGVAVVWWLT